MFSIFKGRDGLFYWHIKAKNGEIVAQSEGYRTEQSARDGANSAIRIVLEHYR